MREITLTPNEGNVLRVSFEEMDNAEDFIETFKADFEKTGHINVQHDEVNRLHIIRVDDFNEYRFEDWEGYFLNKSAELDTIFIVSFIPYINAANAAVSYTMHEGVIYSESRLSFTLV